MIDFQLFLKTINHKPVAVFGPGGSGLSVTRALRHAGATVFIGDDNQKNFEPIKDIGCLFLNSDFSNLSQCAVLILGPGVPYTHPIPHPVVQSALKAGVEIIGDIELFARAQTGHKTIGITGTNGKSTTTALIAHILNACGKNAVACGNIGNPICAITPSPDSIFVIEMSSFQIDLCPTFRPNISIHLNITPDHLDRHGTLNEYIGIKERLFEGPGLGFCGIDDIASSDIFNRTKKNNPARTMIALSVLNPLQGDIFVTESGDVFDHTFSSSLNIGINPIGSFNHLPTLHGIHNFQNALFAYAATRACACTTTDIFESLKTYPGLPHRQLNIRTIGQVNYINDSKATNADATEKALKTFDNIHWIVGGLPKSGGLSGLEPLASRVTRAYIIGAATNDFSNFMLANNIPFEQSETLETAVAAAHHNAQSSNDPATVLLSPACASYDQFKSYEHRGDIFTTLVHDLPAFVRDITPTEKSA